MKFFESATHHARRAAQWAKFKYVRARLFVNLKLVALRTYLRKRLYKRTINEANLVFFLVAQKLRLQNPEIKQIGWDKRLDNIIDLAVEKILQPYKFNVEEFRLLVPQPGTQLEADFLLRHREYLENQTEVDGFISSAIFKDDFKRTVADYFLVLAHANDLAGLDHFREYNLRQFHTYATADATPNLANAIKDVVRRTKADFKVANWALSEREAFKVKLTAQNVGYILALSSPLFLLTGYLYNKVYLGQFGIDASHYFDLSDYVVASVDELRYAAFSAILAVVFTFLGYHDASRKPAALIVHQQSRQRGANYTFLGLLALLSLAALTAGPPVVYYLGSTFIYLLSLPIAAKLSKRFFVNDIPVLFSLVFAIGYFTALFGSLFANAYIFQSGEHKAASENFEFTEELRIDLDQVRFLGANSKYLFFWNPSTHQSFVVPSEKIKMIRIDNANNSDPYMAAKEWLKKTIGSVSDLSSPQ